MIEEENMKSHGKKITKAEKCYHDGKENRVVHGTVTA